MNLSIAEQATWDLSQWLVYLESIHNRSIDMGLERVRAVAERLNVLTPRGCCFVVAGTNGKGSTVRYLETMAMAAGHSVIAYTSPHIDRYSERVRWNDQELAESEHVAAFQAIEQARGDISLTYFEFSTLAALWLVQQKDPDVVVLEVGLGGRLDAVNIISADVAVVTSIGIDHVALLGNNRDDIGYEKAGVYRQGLPAVCGDPEPPARLVNHAQSIGADFYRVNHEFRGERHADTFDFYGPCATWKDLPIPQLPYANALTALAALQLSGLSFNVETIRQGLAQARLPGRMEVLSTQPTLVVDVGHNPHAAEYLCQELQVRYPHSRFRIICAMLNDKDHAGTMAPFAELADAWYLAPLSGERGTSAETLVKHLPQRVQAPVRYQTFASVGEALQATLVDIKENDVIVGFGSFLTVAAIKKAFQKG
ncbi:bifunctional tetrahydrofolate synthase/dihydrofolate synthase [Aliidiomarina haloalkalitolerans]|uniref:Dihydrofolate synthase/folylpolyglutamate synthase n=1 Tax=Aliidiomarina haloalkalitolerans TaxID=859059 RepID=A0A432VQT8_9GAMM|nr:bifunctional tetrahydrofolate synthase/dihydrofolate synthase [Aliidiomarina haloalkalitolerans]RUO18631.1 bifunctional tetrahydrofolate synthase/dihydrofolate synthase [Aliidiomarina haloalkalitolerans]